MSTFFMKNFVAISVALLVWVGTMNPVQAQGASQQQLNQAARMVNVVKCPPPYDAFLSVKASDTMRRVQEEIDLEKFYTYVLDNPDKNEQKLMDDLMRCADIASFGFNFSLEWPGLMDLLRNILKRLIQELCNTLRENVRATFSPFRSNVYWQPPGGVPGFAQFQTNGGQASQSQTSTLSLNRSVANQVETFGRWTVVATATDASWTSAERKALEALLLPSSEKQVTP